MDATNLKQVHLHAFIAYCYTEGKVGPGDLITPLIKKTIATFYKNHFTPEEIQREVIKDFSKNFPLIIIERELHKLASLKIIERNIDEKTKNEYILKQDLSDIKDEFRLSQDETNFFLENFKEFLLSKNTGFGDLKLSALLKRLEDFCMENMIPIIDYFGGNAPAIKKVNPGRDIDILIEEFFNKRVNNDSRLMSEFEKIFNGINLLFIFENCTDFISKTNYTLNEKCFYLDTNVLLRILGLQDAYLNKIGKELYSFLVKHKFTMKIFRITLEELFALIRGYNKSSQYFIKGKNICHVYQTLKDQGYESFQIDDLLLEITEKIKKLNIDIDDSTNWTPVDYKEFEDNIEKLARMKFEKRNENEDVEFDIYDDSSQKYLYQAKHDMRCIELIKSLRGNISQRRFEDERYYFITAEGLLLKFNRTIGDKYAIKETVGDFTLSFLLYFQDPENVKGIALHSFIAANYNNTELSVNNWIKYVRVVTKKYQNNELNKEQMGFLFTKTILNNNRFESEDLNDIINDGLSEYTEMIEQFDALKREKAKADVEKSRLLAEKEDAFLEIEHQNEEAGKLFEKIGTLELTQNNLQSTVTGLETEISGLRTQMGFIRKLLFIIFSLIIVISIILFFSNKLIGSILFVFGLILDVLNFIDKIKKAIIKD